MVTGQRHVWASGVNLTEALECVSRAVARSFTNDLVWRGQKLSCFRMSFSSFSYGLLMWNLLGRLLTSVHWKHQFTFSVPSTFPEAEEAKARRQPRLTSSQHSRPQETQWFEDTLVFVLPWKHWAGRRGKGRDLPQVTQSVAGGTGVILIQHLVFLLSHHHADLGCLSS